MRNTARAIADKYQEPPRSTDFAILFLPTEGWYAEVLRRPAMMGGLQRELRVTLAGSTTLPAIALPVRQSQVLIPADRDFEPEADEI